MSFKDELKSNAAMLIVGGIALFIGYKFVSSKIKDVAGAIDPTNSENVFNKGATAIAKATIGEEAYSSAWDNVFDFFTGNNVSGNFPSWGEVLGTDVVASSNPYDTDKNVTVKTTAGIPLKDGWSTAPKLDPYTQDALNKTFPLLYPTKTQ